MFEEYIGKLIEHNLHRGAEILVKEVKNKYSEYKANKDSEKASFMNPANHPGQYYDAPRRKWVRNDMVWDPKTKSYVFK